jgi:hypothetical protein
MRPPTNAHSAGLKSRITGTRRPSFRCLRGWSWTPEIDLELELHDGDGKLLARIEHNRGRYRLTHPPTVPILSWPDDDLEIVKHSGESIALNALSLDTATAARIRKENATPNPMGPPLNRQLSRETAIPSDWKPAGNGDVPELPAFLRRPIIRKHAAYLQR